MIRTWYFSDCLWSDRAELKLRVEARSKFVVLTRACATTLAAQNWENCMQFTMTNFMVFCPKYRTWILVLHTICLLEWFTPKLIQKRHLNIKYLCFSEFKNAIQTDLHQKLSKHGPSKVLSQNLLLVEKISYLPVTLGITFVGPFQGVQTLWEYKN